MPGWLIGIITSLGWPIVKQLIIFLLRMAEAKFPGAKALIEGIIQYLESGGNAQALQAHCEKCEGFCPAKK